jgi:drug/metabolite transporter (DMT)-like permease
MLSTASLFGLIFGLASALSWGSGDFCGGMATRRTPVKGVLLFSQLIGALLLIGLVLIIDEPLPPARSLIFGALAGLCGGCGLLALYSGLAQGRMGFMAPLTAIIAAALPVITAFFTQGRPPFGQLAGFGLALIAVWLLAAGDDRAPLRLRMLVLPLIAGLGFGLFFILIAQASQQAVVWPLIALRLATLTLLVLLGLMHGGRVRPERRQFPLIVAAGLFDVGGNLFYALATRFGRMDVATVLSSLYPAATVLLAWLILKEHLSPRQWLGLLIALAALALIAMG